MDEIEYLNQIQKLLHNSPNAKTCLHLDQEKRLCKSNNSSITNQWNDRGLRFYTRSAQHRRFSFLRHVYPRLFALLSISERKEIEANYYTQNAGSHCDWIWNAELFETYIHQKVHSKSLPAYMKSLVTHEWCLFRKGLEDSEPAHQSSKDSLPIINSTLSMETYDVDPLHIRKVGREITFKAQTTHVGYYLHPSTLRSHSVHLTPFVLAGLRIVEERIPYQEVALQSKISEQEVHTQVEQLQKLGLLITQVYFETTR